MNGMDLHHLENLHLAAALLLVGMAMGISKFLHLSMEKDFFVASLRTTVQLVAAGFILRWIFQGQSLAMNFVVLILMTGVAAQAVVSRLNVRTWKSYVLVLVTLIGSVWSVGLSVLALFFGAEALMKTSFFIPFMGVALGNALSGISLAFVGFERSQQADRAEIETFKALGADSLESCHRIYREILRSSLLPILNGMTIVGVVSLPGVMAGQVIGGVDPMMAARFQIVVMFMLLLTAVIGVLLALGLCHSTMMPEWVVKKISPWTFLEEGWVFLCGPSGVGKSRLLKSLAGLDCTHIRKRIHESHPEMIRQCPRGRVVYLSQQPQFTPGSVYENLLLPFKFKSNQGLRYDPELISQLLKEIGLAEDILQKEAARLSGGERQTIALIRGLQLRPRILFLDEPTSALDSVRTANVENLLNHWRTKESCSLVMVTHNMEQKNRLAEKTLSLGFDGVMSSKTEQLSDVNESTGGLGPLIPKGVSK